MVEGKQIIYLSPHAPLAKGLLHKKAGDPFVFNGSSGTISDVY
jgi:transcription elongation GreA/GreB family factor